MNESEYNWMPTYRNCRSPFCFNLINLTAADQPVRFIDCEFVEPVFLQTLKVSRAWRFVNCRFKRLFDATDARFEFALTFKDCIFEESITLRNAAIGGTFDFTGSVVLLPIKSSVPQPDELVQLFDPPPDERSAKWQRLRVNGDLLADCTGFLGSLNLGESQIEGRASFRGTFIGAFPKREFSNEIEVLANALRTNIPLEKRHLLSNQLQFSGRFYLRGSTIKGDFDLSPAELHGTGVNDSDYSGNVADRYHKRAELLGSLSVGLSHIHGRLNLRGAKIDGAIHAIMARIDGRVLADPFWNAKQLCVHETRIGYAHYNEQSVLPPGATEHVLFRRRTSLYFQDVTVAESVWLHGIKAEGALNFENAEIGGSLRLEPFHHPGSAVNLHGRFTEVAADERGDSIILRNAVVKSSIYLNGAYLNGRIWARNLHVSGDFMLGAQSRIHYRRDATYIHPVKGAAEGNSISLHGAKIGGCFDFSGAILKGSIRLRYTHIQGAIIGGDSRKKRGEYLPAGNGGLASIIGCDEEGYALYLYNTYVGGNVHCPSIVLEGRLSMELSCVKGEVIFARSHIEPKTVASARKQGGKRDAAVLFDRATIDADVQFEGARIVGDFQAIGVKIGGDLEFAEVRTVPPDEPSTTTQEFTDTEIVGSLDLTTARIHRLRFGFPVKKFKTNPIITGPVNLSHCKLNILQVWGNWPSGPE